MREREGGREKRFARKLGRRKVRERERGVVHCIHRGGLSIHRPVVPILTLSSL